MTEGSKPGPPLPFGAIGTSAAGWWGAWLFLLTEASAFSYVFFTYIYYLLQPPSDWSPGGPPAATYAGFQTGAIIVACLSAWAAQWAVRRELVLVALIALAGTFLLAAGFIALQFMDWSSKPFDFPKSTYSSVFFLVSGFYLAHVFVGCIMSLLLLVWTALGYFDHVRHVPISIGSLYWFFLAIAWLAVFVLLYGTPYLSKAS
jgi:cytochrome c oxidase subunit 3